eukprot:COSAG06_NODE_23_length_33072_cov_44.622327_5_plen_39_part_00
MCVRGLKAGSFSLDYVTYTRCYSLIPCALKLVCAPAHP